MENAKFRWWIITWNNPPTPWQAALDTLKADYCIGQLEQGENGTPHIQAAIWFSISQRASKFKGLPLWSKGVQAGAAAERIQNYCQKSTTRVDGPYSYGIKPYNANSAMDWEAIWTAVKERRLDEIPPKIKIAHWGNIQKIMGFYSKGNQQLSPRGLWIYGQPGVGKTQYVKTLSSSCFKKNQTKWWDNYKGQETIVLDDLDTLGKCLSHHLKIWLDGDDFVAETKGGVVEPNYTLFIITSNYLPEELWEGKDLEAIQRRCKFTFITGQNYHDPNRQILVGSEFGKYPLNTYQQNLYCNFLNE